MHVFLLLFFALALFGGLFGRIIGFLVRVVFLLILAAMFIHP